ncbi:hypothetical protein [Pseudomonas sp. zfem002]|nr:hypothetical protein [Pseudomonas sp. zfem002]MDU9390752.1 hypothetical protein [Pseudomonas sp. zfem002]
MSRYRGWLAALVVAAVLLGLVWWGWQRGGLALMQLGMGVC